MQQPTPDAAPAAPAAPAESAFATAARDAVSQADGFTAQVVAPLQTTLVEIWRSFLEHTPYLLAGLIMLLVTWGVAHSFRRAGYRLFRDRRMRESLKDLIVKLLTITIWIVGLLLTAMLWFPGLTPTGALAGLGLLSIAVGFAFQDIFENFFAGVLMLWRFPFEKGDFIECGEISGSVENIDIRMTQIRQTTGELLLVPNSKLFKNAVTVLTDQPKRRVRLVCGVAYHTDVEEAVQLLQQTVESCSSVDGGRPVQVFPCEFGASSVDIELTWWTDPKPGQMRASRAEVVMAVKRALDGAGIEIPFPQRTLSFAEALQVDAGSATGAGAAAS